MVYIIVAVLAVVVIFLVIKIIKGGKPQENPVSKKLAPYIDAEYYEKLEREQTEAAKNKKEDEPKLWQKLADGIGKVFLFEGYRNKIQEKLAKAGVKLRVNEFFLFSLVSAFFASIFGFIMFRLLGMVIFAIIGYFIPNIVISRKRKKRVQAFNDQLVDSLMLVSNSLKAGFSFPQAIAMLQKEAPAPTSEEFERVLRENSLGVPLEEALERLTKRVESDDLDLVITAVLIQRQIGGNLAEILDSIAATVRERIKILGQIQTLTAQGRMGGMVITALPFALFGIMYLLQKDVMSILFTDKLGLVLIGIGLFMQAMGGIVIKKIIDIEV